MTIDNFTAYKSLFSIIAGTHRWTVCLMKPISHYLKETIYIFNSYK